MFWKKQKPVRLQKKVSYKERLIRWYKRNRFYFFIGGAYVALFFFVYFCLMFMPGTESGVYYNNRSGVLCIGLKIMMGLL